MKFSYLIIAGLWLAGSGLAAEPVREIAADWQRVKGPHVEVFRACVGAGRAAEGLRAEWQRQLKLCQEEIGFKYVRFHGLLHDDMGVYAEKDGQPRYSWRYIDELYDALLALKVPPFVELSFMPSALANGSKTVFWWKGNVTPPKSYEKWDALIKALVQHWVERYGADEVAKWYFEVWNEADYKDFWEPRDPSRRREEYFELYQHTAAAIKSVNPTFQVGGPAGAQVIWVQPLIEFCTGQHVPLDFISFHAYGLGGGPGGLDEYGEALHYLSPNLRSPADTMMQGRSLVDAMGKKDLPIHVTEWSTSYSPRDPVHDAYFSAPYILENVKRAERGLASMSYWTFTDIFEEAGPPMAAFHGGFGLLTLQGIKKPSFFAYEFMHRLGPLELENPDPASWVCRDDKGNAQVLLWNLTGPVGENESTQAIFRKLQPPKSLGSTRVRLSQVPPGKYTMTVRQVGYEKNDAYSAWLAMGGPAQLTRAQEGELRGKAAGKPEVEREVTVGADGMFEQTLPLRENDVILISLTRK